mmetsp:Transcript_34846/g.45879  ORF Transcript_34846/g.45879 Transcript_34846/m.45879 type:complete len:109 (-) Transcript_34846:1642-1968(-)
MNPFTADKHFKSKLRPTPAHALKREINQPTKFNNNNNNQDLVLNSEQDDLLAKTLLVKPENSEPFFNAERLTFKEKNQSPRRHYKKGLDQLVAEADQKTKALYMAQQQ